MAVGLTRNAVGVIEPAAQGRSSPRPLAGDLLEIRIGRIQPRDMDDVFEPSLQNRPRDREPLAPFVGVIEPAAG